MQYPLTCTHLAVTLRRGSEKKNEIKKMLLLQHFILIIHTREKKKF